MNLKGEQRHEEDSKHLEMFTKFITEGVITT